MHLKDQDYFQMNIKYRDIEIIPLDNDRSLVVACDSCGGIGIKALDAVKASNETVGKLTARVALMEVMAAGGIPVALTAAICNEDEPTGKALLTGIRLALEESGLEGIALSISTEKNIPTQQTALGITIVGIVKKEALKVHSSRVGSYVYAAGIPKVGQEVLEDHGEIADFDTLKQLIAMSDLNEILPVGSRGILKEGNALALSCGGAIELVTQTEVDVHKSAGPCTSILFTADKLFKSEIKLNVPFVHIGRIVAKI
jgi:hypothetical protein